MKVRLKFSKSGVMKYIGHLDMMRYFQKCMRKADVDIAYSTGYSPHQIMSFASPLGVGMESTGEYFDIELNSGSAQSVKDSLNAVMVPGVEILSVKKLPSDAQNAMASIAAAKYTVEYKDESKKISSIIDNNDINTLLSKDSIVIIKQTKKQELEMDIKPHIFELSIDSNGLTALVDASSAGNIKPLMVLKELFKDKGLEINELDFLVTRIETYTRLEDKLISLDEVGEEF